MRFYTDRKLGLVNAALVWGGLWGAAEATAGLALHLAGRVVPVPGLAGFLMFPLGLGFLLEARRASGSDAAVPLAALTAASVKAASAFLPGVGWLFVGNPALAILAQGLAVYLGGSLLEGRRGAAAFGWGAALALSWRLAFLVLVFLLPVQKGILRKGWPALAWFLAADSLANGAVIALAVSGTGLPDRVRSALSRPAFAPLAVVLGLAAQAAAAS